MENKHSTYEAPDVRSKRIKEEQAELKRKSIEDKTKAINAYQSKLLQLISRHSAKYPPYRTTCPKDIKYDDLLKGVDSTVLLQLLQEITEDQLSIQRILSSRYDNVIINIKKSRY